MTIVNAGHIETYECIRGVAVNFNQMVVGLGKRFPVLGKFDLLPGESINSVVRHENVPNQFGVYIIYEGLGCNGPILYIGKAGTINQDGTRKQQGVRNRLTMKQDGVLRKYYFPKVIRERSLKGLSFAWFVTFAESQTEPPALVEAELLSAYLWQYGQLPSLNKAF